MKRPAALLLLLLLAVSAVSAKNYELDQKEVLPLDGVGKIVFRMTDPDCALCTVNVVKSFQFAGGGSGDSLYLKLEGSIESNKKSAVPKLIVEKAGNTVTVRLTENEGFIFNLVQSGEMEFNAGIPASFDGDVEVVLSSGELAAENLNASAISLSTDYGFLRADNISASELNVFSGHGKIGLNKIIASESLDVTAGHGEIRADSVECRAVRINSDWGEVSAAGLNVDSAAVDACYGDLELDFRRLGKALDIESEHGNVLVVLPSVTAFSAELETECGNVSSGFSISGGSRSSESESLSGDAAGGGVPLKIRLGYGDIRISEG